VLILHLKRYSFNAQLSLNSKLGQQVLIPRFLTLLSHCTDSTRPPISLGWTCQASMSRTLKTSQSVNASTTPLSCSSVLLDSDCEDEPTRKVNTSCKRRLSICLPEDDGRPEEKTATVDPAEFSGINDDEMLAAALEMSRQEAGLSAAPALEDEPTSSPDTGFGDSDVHDLAYHTDLLETDNKQPAGNVTRFDSDGSNGSDLTGFECLRPVN
ncbi:hypothetical protein XENOCAPTIV_019262, partial [Xenoophorus captivus]